VITFFFKELGCLAFSHPALLYLFIGVCAPLLRFGSLQWLGYQEPVFPRFSLPGTVHSCAFSSLQWFSLPGTSRVYFTPIHSWDFPSELSPLRDWFLLSRPFDRLFEDPCHFTVGCSTYRIRDCCAIRVITTALQFGFRAFFPLKARSHQARD
jgi:hypothetical protein